MSKIIKSIGDIISLYDVFILDQWGVMHDGYKGYDLAINSVEKLIRENKKLIIISNSSKRKTSSIVGLKSLGFDKNHFIEVMTSGEMIWQEIFTSIDNYGNNIKNCFHIYNSSKEDGLEFRNGLEKFNFVSNISEANFILACTPFENTEPIDYIPILKDALDMNLVMFCANPDFVTIEKNNDKNIYCMGTIADLYEHMGGRVVILGKPSKEIYKVSCKKIEDLNKSKILAIGDSLDHDILGANNFNIDSVLISSGIHKDLFVNGPEIGINDIKNSKKWNFSPTYVCENFIT
jgi:HAD superfamily hydrolase (TIGR01459 family)